MLFRWLLFVWMFVLDLAAASGMTEDEKDLEIVLLRQQLRIVERRQQRGPEIPRWQKVPLVALAVKLKAQARDASTRLKGSMILFKLDTVLGWHGFRARKAGIIQDGGIGVKYAAFGPR